MGVWGRLERSLHLFFRQKEEHELSSSTTAEESEPVTCVLQGDDIQALAIKVEDLEKVCVLLVETATLADALLPSECSREGADHSLITNPTPGVQFSSHFVHPALYDLSHHQVQLLQ